jgi:hypothetical protein
MFYRDEIRRDWKAYQDLCSWFISNRINIKDYLRLYFPTFKFYRYVGSNGLPMLTKESLEYMRRLKKIIESENHEIATHAIRTQVRRKSVKKK